MNLTTDQQKTIYSLIDNSTTSDYAEVRDELYDHFISGISSYLENGLSFTDSLNAVYNDLEGQEGMCRIEAGYINMTRKLGKSLYKKFTRQYLLSFRWLAAILTAGLIILISPNLPFSVIAITVFIFLSANFYCLWFFRKWRLAGEHGSYYNEKKNLKAVTVYNFYIWPMVFSSQLAFIPTHTNHEIVLVISIAMLLIILDFSISFIKYMKQNWLLPEMNLA